MAQNSWILRFGELGLKSRPVRRNFQKALRRNLEQLALNSNTPMIHELIRQQEIISSSAPIADVEDLLCHILGVVAIDRVVLLCQEVTPIAVAKAYLSRDENVGKSRTFGVRVRRVGENKEWNSQSFAGAVGAAMLGEDDSLSVNLREPDRWVKLIMESDRVSLVEERISGAGGLPAGVQGDVLVQIKDRDDMLGAFLIMRRGTRLIPVLDCDEKYIAMLSKFDPFIGSRSHAKDEVGKRIQRPAWGALGLTKEQAAPFVQKRIDSVKTTPLSTLEPLCGWTEEEKIALLNHMEKPSINLSHPDLTSWIDS
ncbi:MAG: hypothetical protein HOE79_07510 [Euryarchaeota archaeon]|nr:hypothetical protein [Euryarchaeota archaeon]